MEIQAKKKNIREKKLNFRFCVGWIPKKKKQKKVAYTAIIVYDKTNCGKEIPAASSIIEDATLIQKLI